MKSIKNVYSIFLILAVTACTPFGKLYKEQPRVTLALPALEKQQFNLPVSARTDTAVSTQPADEGFLFVSSSGDSVPITMSVEWDSINKETLTTLALDEVVVSARSVRNTAERNGMINIEFVVTVPKELQKDDWMVNVRPVLINGESSDSLKELRFTGPAFRESQERDYRRYDRFLQSIIPDSVNFYHTFVDYRSFERYLQRLQWYKRGLEKRWAVLEAKRRRPDPLLLRFDMFNKLVDRHDTLMRNRMQENAMRMIGRQQWKYGRAWERMNDTLEYKSRYLLERFRLFNMRGEHAAARLGNRYLGKTNFKLFSLYADSVNRWDGYNSQLTRAGRRADALVARKEYFHDRALLLSTTQVDRSLYAGGVNPQTYYSRFIFFNDKMDRLNAALYMHYRKKGARAESAEGVKLIKAFISGRDTASAYLNRSQLAAKYTARYEKIRDFFPMFHFRRPEADTLAPSWINPSGNDTVETRRVILSRFSEKEIRDYYLARVRPDTIPRDSASIKGRYAARYNFFHSLLPMYTFRRELPDSVQHRTPSMKVVHSFESSLFEPEQTMDRYMRRYRLLRDLYPQYRLQRELVNINPPAVKFQARRDKMGERISRIEALDSASLVKMFYNTQKIARNEARKAIKDVKFYDMVRFPYNPGARLDTVIYAADKVHFLYSEKIRAEEGSNRMKVFVTGQVVNSTGNEFPLPPSDTLTYLVSSMTKFVDKTPRYVRKILTRDAEANVSVNFLFNKNRFRLDRSNEVNRKGVKEIQDLTLALMTDPVYRIDSLTLFATSSPEGNWRINGEIAQKRAESIREILVKDFTVLYDSLAVGAAMEMDEAGNVIRRETKDDIPDLPRLIKIRTVPEDWNKLRRLIVEDKDFKGDKEKVLSIIDKEKEPDRREWLIKSRYKTEYAHMVEKLYPIVRAVDFRFSLSRKGMQQDTLYTTEPDTAYARAVECLEKRKYEQALEILKTYEGRNTAIAYMSLGYDKAALRILEKLKPDAENKYLSAILNARLGNERQAVILLLEANDLDGQMKHRANLDPELSALVKKYGLFKEDDEWNF